MPWLVLLISAVCEAVWASALGASNGLTELIPSIVFVVGLIGSSIGLAWAVKFIPIGTAYAVWTGIGAALTVTFAMLVGMEPVTPFRILFIALIVMSVVGLKLVPTPDASDVASEAEAIEP